MRRRTLVAALAAMVPTAVASQLSEALGGGRTAIQRRPGVDEALRRTVTLVLRAEARSNGLPDFLTDPQPLTDEQLENLTTGARLPEDFPLIPAPEGVNRRLPHTRGGSVWAAAGTWMVEVDPVRLVVLSVAHDVLPPDL